MTALAAAEPGRAYALLLIPSPRNRNARAAPDVAAWLSRLELEGKRPRTLSNYAQTGDLLLAQYPRSSLDELSAADLETFLRGFPAPSRHIRRAHVASLYRFAHIRGLVGDDRMLHVAKMKPPRRQQKPAFTVPEKELLMGLPSPDGPLMAVLFLSGIRLSEAIALQVKHVVVDHEPDGRVTGRLLIREGKGGKDRTVHMRKLAVILNDLILFDGLHRDDFLWYTRPGGGRISRRDRLTETSFYAWWDRCLALAGIDPGRKHSKGRRTPHSTRHSFAYHYIADGGDLGQLSLMLGHESIQTTFDIYVRGHVAVVDIQAELERIGG